MLREAIEQGSRRAEKRKSREAEKWIPD